VGKKHDRTLAAIFTDPLPANVKWRDVEALFVALGGQLVEGRGSRVTVFLNDATATFHRPHPRPDTDRGALRAVRRFLLQAGVGPDKD
jgi:hypothetical protein